jgi:hypothetical protein
MDPSGSETPRVGRATRILQIFVHPRSRWRVVKHEHETVKDLYRDYILWLSLIPAWSGLLDDVFEAGHPFAESLLYALVLYGLSIAFPAVAALIVERVASLLEGTADPLDALKLVTYSYIPWCISGIWKLLPSHFEEIGTLLSFYGLYVFFSGIEDMVSVPEDRTFAFSSTCLLLFALVLLLDLGVLSAVAALPVRR